MYCRKRLQRAVSGARFGVWGLGVRAGACGRSRIEGERNLLAGVVERDGRHPAQISRHVVQLRPVGELAELARGNQRRQARSLAPAQNGPDRGREREKERESGEGGRKSEKIGGQKQLVRHPLRNSRQGHVHAGHAACLRQSALVEVRGRARDAQRAAASCLLSATRAHRRARVWLHTPALGRLERRAASGLGHRRGLDPVLTIRVGCRWD